jgi:two-component system nitrogen regulation sensor histidine kinase GlnL
MSASDKARTSADPQFYARVLENVEDAVIALDRHGRITLFNPAAENLTGMSRRQCFGHLFETLFRGQSALLTLVQCVIREARSIVNYEELLLLRPAGAPLPVSISVSPILDHDGSQEGVVLILRDLSRIKELEAAVRRTDRLSMIGTMAAGLAHEIKNPLGGIRGAAQLMAQEFSADNDLQEYTRVMIREVERINSIIEELMDLSSPRRPETNEVNLAKLLGDIVLFQREALRHKKIDFALKLDPSIPPIKGDENLLTRLFLNLIKNAGEAVEKGGRVEIVTRVASEYHLQQPGDRPIPFIVVDISDDGPGIAKEQMEQIFTPFFTTKTQGSGLGLAICQKIISEHQGFLKVDSRPGQKTTFSVSLPFYR